MSLEDYDEEEFLERCHRPHRHCLIVEEWYQKKNPHDPGWQWNVLPPETAPTATKNRRLLEKQRTKLDKQVLAAIRRLQAKAIGKPWTEKQWAKWEKEQKQRNRMRAHLAGRFCRSLPSTPD
jgi:hypothetical protein